LATADILGQNSLLRAMDGPRAAYFLSLAKVVDLAIRQKIYDPDEPIATVYFPITSVLSVVARMEDGGMIEVGTIGKEGVSALPLLLGSTTSANECYCQVPGIAIAITSEFFMEISNDDREFRRLLDRYLQAYINFLGQLAACNRLHSVYERCARWLLLTHDRVAEDDLPLTHEFLAMMLGTRRSGVTIAAATLQKAGFIQYGKGHIKILDRPGLEDASCECYGVAQEQFAGLLR
jgi:CRP-like cAMP-binding protein